MSARSWVSEPAHKLAWAHGRSRRALILTMPLVVVASAWAVHWPSRAIVIFGGMALVVVALVVPELLLVTAPVLMVAAYSFGNSKGLLALPVLIIIPAVAGMVNGRLRVLPALHGVAAALAVWLILSYWFATKAGVGPRATDNLVTAVLMLGLCGAAGALRPNRTHLLISLASTGFIAAVMLRISSAAYSSDLGDARLGLLNLNPNGAGLLLAWGFLACVTLVVVRREPLWLVPGAVVLSAMPLVKSRGSIVVVAVGLVAMVLFRQERRIKLAAAAVALAVLVAVPNIKTVVVNATLRDRADQLSSKSDDARRDAGIEGFKAGLAHPVLGIGWSRFPLYAASIPKLGIQINTHDDYAKLFGETGLPGLLLYLSLFGFGLRSPMRSDEDWACRSLIAAFAVSGLLANYLVELLLAVPVMLILGASIAAGREQATSPLVEAPTVPMPAPPI